MRGSLVFAELSIDRASWQVHIGGLFVPLTKTQFELLWVLACRAHTVVSEQELTELVWGANWVGDDNNIAVHMSHLRRKLGESGTSPRLIRTVRGVGYRFDPTACAPVPDPTEVSFGVVTDRMLRVLGVVTDQPSLLGYPVQWWETQVMSSLLPTECDSPARRDMFLTHTPSWSGVCTLPLKPVPHPAKFAAKSFRNTCGEVFVYATVHATELGEFVHQDTFQQAPFGVGRPETTAGVSTLPHLPHSRITFLPN